MYTFVVSRDLFYGGYYTTLKLRNLVSYLRLVNRIKIVDVLFVDLLTIFFSF